MNINDVDINNLAYMNEFISVKDLPKDKLEAMFMIQDKLRQKFGVPIKSLDTAEGQKIARDMAFNVIQEACEAINLMKNHEWSSDEKLLDTNHFKEEIGDTILFFVEFLIVCGFTADDIFKIYLKIAEKNFFRIKTRY
jgi:hypothetical protein